MGALDFWEGIDSKLSREELLGWGLITELFRPMLEDILFDGKAENVLLDIPLLCVLKPLDCDVIPPIDDVMGGMPPIDDVIEGIPPMEDVIGAIDIPPIDDVILLIEDEE